MSIYISGSAGRVPHQDFFQARKIKNTYFIDFNDLIIIFYLESMLAIPKPRIAKNDLTPISVVCQRQPAHNGDNSFTFSWLDVVA
ncbi:hypothetical protein [Ewingella americana]|uniref:Uncharacterized protein n=1 Tax=Ewingella americana TaxID=41202 RepID=A0A502G760_9GAMM|nr:hypothetical protein [Ewingella americana]TPG57947.1 hypothetical protein EAH77_19970 [Ewingella americana]